MAFPTTEPPATSIHASDKASTEEARKKLNAILRERRMHHGDIVAALGCSRQGVSMTACGSQLNRPLRRRIEKYLGTPIWSTREEWEKANRAEQRLGCDPYIARSREVHDRAAQLGLIPAGSAPTVAEIIERACAEPGAQVPPLSTAPSAARNADSLTELEERIGPEGLQKIEETMAAAGKRNVRNLAKHRAAHPRTQTCPAFD